MNAPFGPGDGIYTLGHGNRSIDEFTELLRQYRITCLVDVRSTPYSKMFPNFNREALAAFLENEGVCRYVWLGDKLGGRPQDPGCYLPDGRVDYNAVAQSDFFNEGIYELSRLMEEGGLVAVACSELRPEECHRSKLIAPALGKKHVPVLHIDDKGRLKTQAQVLPPQQGSLLGDDVGYTSRKSYR